MPIVLDRISNDKRLVVRMCSPRLTVINPSNYKVMRTVDLANHEAALFFADKLTSYENN